MSTMSKKKLKSILEEHAKWIKCNRKGTMADLSWADLTGADLSRANLSWADLRGADLSRADLRWADLRSANLHGADLHEADLHVADLHEAYLPEADLRGAKLRDANLSRADLRWADLTGAKLTDVRYDETTSFFAQVCPENGQFTAFKKCNDGRIVELEVPKNAKRSSATTRKCRVSAAKVVSIASIDKKKSFKTAISSFDENFVYEVGKTVKAKDFDTDRWNECSTGIHCFLTREEAVNY